MEQIERRITPALNLSKYELTVTGPVITATIFWARVVSSETESLLTGYTKHTFFEVQYALEGRIVITVGDNKRFTLDESDFIVIPPDTYHQIVDGDSTGARFIMAFSLSGREETLEHLRAAGARPYRDSAALRAILESILQKGRESSPLCAKTLSCLVEAFLLELCDIVTPPTESGQQERRLTDSAQRVAEICAYIHDFHGIGISVSELSRRFGVGERHLGRLFHAELGHGPREEINHEKLRYIEELIASTALSLSEISALCGFCDEYAMNKFFKRYNKIKLTDYRRTARITDG